MSEPRPAQPGLQPLLHDMMICLAAPTVTISGADGQIRGTGAQGVFSADLRVISTALVRIDGHEAEPIAVSPSGSSTAEFVGLVRRTEDPTPDPVLWLRRHRRVNTDGIQESLVLENVSDQPRDLLLEMEIISDLADIELIKSGRSAVPAAPQLEDAGLAYSTAQVHVRIDAPGAVISAEATVGILRWQLTVPARGSVGRDWTARVHDNGAAVIAPSSSNSFTAPQVHSQDRRLAPLLDQAIHDLHALRLSAVGTPEQTFIAAGAPWYLTLFGRDSLWAARMLLPMGTELAMGTLRTLASFQGTEVVRDTAEEPGKIPHEVRRPQSDLGNTFLPPLYYGTIDATPLWVCLLHDAWRWGADPAEIEQLLPVAEAALNWMRDYGDSDGDGLLEYIDTSGRGLTNQGWKDSGDSVRFADGTIATGPVALAEVQGYAYQAAVCGAALLEAFGRPGSEHWRDYAARLKQIFHQQFWVTDELGDFIALALDGAKRPVDAPSSNMGHLLGTGILTSEQAEVIANRLIHPTLSSGFGLRTMSTTAGGYSPLSYHCGSVWPHDTAIAIGGMVDEGLHEQADVLVEGLLAAGVAFRGRLPELYGGFDVDQMPSPVAYPASCRPQAWSAAAAVVVLRSRLGLRADVPNGTVDLLSTVRDSLRVNGLRIGGRAIEISQVGISDLPISLRLVRR